MSLLGDMTVQITADTSSLTGGISDAVSSVVGFTSSVGFAVTNIENLASSAVNLGTSLLGPAASAEQMQTAFTTLLGSTQAANDEMQKLDAFASKTPFQTMDIDQAASQLIGFGTSASDVIPDLTAIGDALSAVGRGSAANLDSVVNIFGKIQTGGKLTVGTMQELSRNGINAWSILEQQTGKTQAELTKMIQQGLFPAKDAIDDLTQGIEKNPLYAGGMAKQSATMVGLISTLKSNWDQMLVAFGDPILKALEPIVANLGNALTAPAFKEFAGAVGTGIVNVFRDISSVVGGAIGIFSNLDKILGKGGVETLQNVGAIASWVGSQFNYLFQTVISIGINIFNQLKEAFGGSGRELQSGFITIAARVGPMIGQVGDFVHDLASKLGSINFSGVVQGAIQFVSSLSAQFGPAIKNIVSLLSGQFATTLKDIGKDAQQLGTWFTTSVVPAIAKVMPPFMNLAKTLLTTLVPAIIQIRGVLMDVIQHAFQVLAPILEKIIPQVILFAGVVAGVVTQAIKFLTPVILQVANTLGVFIDQLVDRVAPIALQIFNEISNAVQVFSAIWVAIWPYLSQVLAGAWDIIKGIVQIAWSIISGIIEIGLDIISGNWGQAWQDMQAMFSGIWQGILSILQGVWAEIVGVLQGAWAGIQAIFQDAGNWFNNTVWKPVANAFNTVFSGIGQVAQNVWNGIMSGVKSAFNAVINMVNGVINGINSVSGVVGISIPDIPTLASGTDKWPGGPAIFGEAGPELVVGPTLANLAPGSQVIPLDKLPTPDIAGRALSATAPAIATMAATQAQEIHVYVGMDNRAVSESVLSYQQAKTRQLKVVRK